MASLTTHVLDTSLGRPAKGLRLSLYQITEDAETLLGQFTTNADGRVDQKLIDAPGSGQGYYRLVFHAGEYLRKSDKAATSPLFLDDIPIQFGISEDNHYHVPLLLSPYGYSTYRGS